MSNQCNTQNYTLFYTRFGSIRHHGLTRNRQEICEASRHVSGDTQKLAGNTELPYVNVMAIRPYVKNGFRCQTMYHLGDHERIFAPIADILMK